MKNTITAELTRWAVEKIKKEYPQDIALLVGVEGHCVDGDGHGLAFDYFIPATDRGNGLARTFIIDGIGYDLYPRSWERMEKTADLEDTATLCLARARILYCRSREDEERFLALQKKLTDNLKDSAFVYRKALENLDTAMDLYRTMMFETKSCQIRMAAGYIAHYLILAVTYLNGTYEKCWSDGNIPHLRSLKALPEHFIEYYQAILEAEKDEELKQFSWNFIHTTRAFIAGYRREKEADSGRPDFAGLADWYQEISLWWRRLRYYCRSNNQDAAFVEACNLQSELNVVSREFPLKEMNLLGAYHPSELSALSSRATELEQYVVDEIQSHGVKLNCYDSLEEFLAANP